MSKLTRKKRQMFFGMKLFLPGCVQKKGVKNPEAQNKLLTGHLRGKTQLTITGSALVYASIR